jgi:hypothetical protein
MVLRTAGSTGFSAFQSTLTLRAHVPLFDQPPEELHPLLLVGLELLAQGRLLWTEAPHEALGIDHDLRASTEIRGGRIDVETHVDDLAGRQAEHRDRGAHGQPPERFSEIQHVPA